MLATAIDFDDGTASLELAWSVAGYFDLKDSAAREIAREVGQEVRSSRVEAARAGLTPEEIDRMAPAFEHDDLRAALEL